MYVCACVPVRVCSRAQASTLSNSGGRRKFYLPNSKIYLPEFKRYQFGDFNLICGRSANIFFGKCNLLLI